MKTSIFKKIAATFLLAVMLVPSIASAAWWTPQGLMSNVCVTPLGYYMVFPQNYGRVGSPCAFQFYNSPVIHYGTWQ